jgi:hypothetical protein
MFANHATHVRRRKKKSPDNLQQQSSDGPVDETRTVFAADVLKRKSQLV